MAIPITKQLKAIPKIPKSVWALGFVSMFTDISSDFINSLLPLYMSSVLGASIISIGLIEGIAEALVLITKVFSGVLSDIIKKRKMLAVLGYGISAVAKLIFPVASSLGFVMLGRFTDRFGKGIREAPRDALMGELAPMQIRGLCFGIRQTLDNIGAFVGPMLAMLLMMLFVNDFSSLFWIAVIPGFLSVILLIVAVHEPVKDGHTIKQNVRISLVEITKLSPRYWLVVAIATALMFARFSQAFLILRASTVGISFAMTPIVIIVMNIVSALSAYYAGYFSDSFNRLFFIVAGFFVLIGSDIILGYANNPWHLIAGVALWGLHIGLTQGVFDALIVDTTHSDIRGSAFGIFNCICGIAIVMSNVIAGWIWKQYSPATTFLMGACFAVVTLLFFVIKLFFNHHKSLKSKNL